MTDDLEAKLPGGLDRAAGAVGGGGLDRDGVSRRVAERSRRRRQRRKLVGALGAGVFVVALVGVAVAVGGHRTTRTAGQVEDFGPICAVAQAMPQGGTDTTGQTPAQQIASVRKRVADLRRVAPPSLQHALDLMLSAADPSLGPANTDSGSVTTLSKAQVEDAMGAERLLTSSLIQHCHVSQHILGSTSTAKVDRSAGSSSGSGSSSEGATGSSEQTCLSSDGAHLCLIGPGNAVRFEATDLEPDSAISVELVPPTSDQPRSQEAGTSGDTAPATTSAKAGHDGTYRPTNIGFLRASTDDRVQVRVVFTPRAGTEQVAIITT